ncbi:hypothetical protein ElyMa_003114700 [Elysia marginata]|uniref:Mos1 transposase HTH domain-containing protein n=1 Tax=Elysia marginata TaxID=1093978 RepID=A0AAV4ITE2_9GAST|nr:hypothetical protein ElyMa_003114700 [Elysia marginata]
MKFKVMLTADWKSNLMPVYVLALKASCPPVGPCPSSALSPSPRKDTANQTRPPLPPSPPPWSPSGANLGVQLVSLVKHCFPRGASVPQVQQAYGHSGGNTPGDMAR